MMIPLVLLISCVLGSINPDYWDPDVVDISKVLLRQVNTIRIWLGNSFTSGSVFSEEEYWQGNYENVSIVGFDFRLNSMMTVHNYKEHVDHNGYKFLFKIRKHENFWRKIRKGQKCFDIDKCSKTEFHNYKTCIDKRHRCRYSHLYIPRLLKETLSMITYIGDEKFMYIYGRQGYEFADGTDDPFSTR